MTPEQQKMVNSKLYTRQPEGEPPVRSSELVRCPNPHCENGVVDTGGSTPWGAWISDQCGICHGEGTISKEQDEAMLRASNKQISDS